MSHSRNVNNSHSQSNQQSQLHPTDVGNQPRSLPPLFSGTFVDATFFKDIVSCLQAFIDIAEIHITSEGIKIKMMDS